TKYRLGATRLPAVLRNVVSFKSMPRFLRSPRPNDRMPRDERGWRVAPAPDGRGMPDPPARRPPHRSRWFVWLVGLLLAVNFGSVLLAAWRSGTSEGAVRPLLHQRRAGGP